MSTSEQNRPADATSRSGARGGASGGMTFQYPVADQRTANDTLWAGPADWISPGFDDGPTPGDSRWRLDPPPNDGTKVVISDTDHYSPMGSDALWAWKSFLRGPSPGPATSTSFSDRRAATRPSR